MKNFDAPQPQVERRDSETRVSPVVGVVVDALEKILVADAIRRSPKGKKSTARKLFDSKIDYGIQKETIQKLREGREVTLCYRFRFPMDKERAHMRLGKPEFRAVGPNGESEEQPFQIFDKITRHSAFQPLRRELDEVNYQLGKLSLGEVEARLRETCPEEAQRYFLAQIEDQAAVYEKMYKELEEIVQAEGADPLVIGSESLTERGAVQECYLLLQRLAADQKTMMLGDSQHLQPRLQQGF